MNFLLTILLALASFTILPAQTLVTTEIQEEPHALPLVAAGVGPGGIGSSREEIWEEDDREVLIRSERGTKTNNNNGSGTGKRGKNKKLKNHSHTSTSTTTTTIITDIDKNKDDSSINSHLHHTTNKHHNRNNNNDNNNNNNNSYSQEQSINPSEHIKQTGNIKTTIKHGNNKKISNSAEHDLIDHKPSSSCRYTKSPWTECDMKTNTRSRTLTLKNKSDNCVPTRTIQKKCKKPCRYEKGTWSECLTGEMTRTDTLKSTSDSACQSTRVINKHCNPAKSKDKTTKERKNKDKGARKGRA